MDFVIEFNPADFDPQPSLKGEGSPLDTVIYDGFLDEPSDFDA